jgi:hypothetical protein
MAPGFDAKRFNHRAPSVSRQDMARARHRLIVSVLTQLARLPRWSWGLVFYFPDQITI